MSTKVLYLEDDPFLSRIVTDGLKSSGYTVFGASDGADAMVLFARHKPDICILDIMLPSKDGYAIAQEIRKLQTTTPIIFLSAKTLTEDIVKGFRLGGNDYLTKPFSMDELLVRMESLLGRIGKTENDETLKKIIYLFGGCELDTVHQTLKTSHGTHSLSFKESALLELMIVHKNDVLERQEALTTIWTEDNYYNTRSMDVFMAHIRKLLKDEPGIQIMNLRGVGYKLVC